MARMNHLKIRHLGVTGEHGGVIGALSARDLLRLRFQELIALGDQIEEAADVPALAAAWAKMPQIAAGLRGDRLSGREVAQVISRRLGALTQRAAVLAEERMQQAGQGKPPCAYAVAVLGSAGRGESLLALDQDNAIVFAQGETDGTQDRWFAALGKHIADILDETGVPYCKGGVMASNAAWRGSVETWRERVRDWVNRSGPSDLLSVDIFFDLRGVHGDIGLANAIWEYAFDVAEGQAAFAKLLVDAAGRSEPGLTWFGNFKTDRGRIDLKKTGLFGIVSAARALAIRHHVRERSTPARFAGVKALGVGSEQDLDALSDAQEVFMDLMLAQQIADIAKGLPASNAIVVKTLSRRDRERLTAALRAVADLEDATRDLLF
jgi:DNA polymerase-3 subunit epsilon/CBS domain-containing protein